METGSLTESRDEVRDVAASEVLDSAALSAHQVVVMHHLAQPVVQIPILKQDPADEILVYQKLEGAKNGRSANTAHLSGQFLSSKVARSRSDDSYDGHPWRSDSMPPRLKTLDNRRNR
ncbi:MAG TPA: hypothetical protein VFB90_01400 [Dehalococcoidia bacterium]|nr:hypothetical protein [Dehalococcoidia bacterium]